MTRDFYDAYGELAEDGPGWTLGAPARAPVPSGPIVRVQDLGSAPVRTNWYDGNKFPGGFGATELLDLDYWTLRARSVQMFRKNVYARGLIRRLVTNEINTGLHLEAQPEEKILGLAPDALADWSEDVENRFRLWSKNPRLCGTTERGSFGALQAQARIEALVSGDVLVLLEQDPRTNLPRVRLVSGSAVQTPIGGSPPALAAGNRIVHGVELDAGGRHVAYWMREQSPGGSFADVFAPPRRLPAYGPRTGRRLAWLVLGTDKLLNDVRGEPILSRVLQCANDIDRYRDATIRKALVNSMLAMFIKKDVDKPGTRPMTMGAVRRGSESSAPGTTEQRSWNVTEHMPGLVLDELQVGEEPHGFRSNGVDEKFGEFEEALVQTIAWENEMPPEILRLSFSNNYSASQAAINEFKIYLNRVRTVWGEDFCQPVYADWLLSEAMSGRISAPELLEAWRDPLKHDLLGAWTSAEWCGQIKPAVDQSKLVKGYELMINLGAITRDRASRELTGTKFSKNVEQLRRENEALAEANKSIVELNKPPAPPPPEADEEDVDQEEDDEEKPKRSDDKDDADEKKRVA